MMSFKHYVITCLNVGVYSHRMWAPDDLLPVDAWMEHRVGLLETFTLPSLRGQTCQNFTWLLFLDIRTPPKYKLWVEALGMPNLRPVYLGCRGLHNQAIAAAVVENTECGEYDLITTEIDSDDAVHKDTIRLIQDLYRPRPHVWSIMFARGIILDLMSRHACLIDYPYHCPTLIEPRSQAHSVYCYPNDRLPARHCELVQQRPYWLQVIHSQNAANTMQDGPSRIIRRDHPVSLSALSAFGVDPRRLLALHA